MIYVIRSLSHKDSNLDKQNQNLLCYHYTMRQSRVTRSKGTNFFAYNAQKSPPIFCGTSLLPPPRRRRSPSPPLSASFVCVGIGVPVASGAPLFAAAPPLIAAVLPPHGAAVTPLCPFFCLAYNPIAPALALSSALPVLSGCLLLFCPSVSACFAICLRFRLGIHSTAPLSTIAYCSHPPPLLFLSAWVPNLLRLLFCHLQREKRSALPVNF